MAHLPNRDDVKHELELMRRLLSALEHAVNRLEQQLERSQMASAQGAPPASSPESAASPTPPASETPSPVQAPASPTPSGVSVSATAGETPTAPLTPPSPQAQSREARSPAPPTPPAKSFEEDVAVRELEQALGGQVALWFGIVLLFLASAFFLSWAWTQMGPWARLGVGYAGGVALVALGWLSRRRSAGWFVDGAIAAGLAILYLTTWAGLQRYEVMRFELAFALMVATTALGVGLAVGRNSQLLASMAVAGGFLTPVVLQSDAGAGKPLGFFTYLAVLNAGLLMVAVWKRWEFQRWLCLIATWVLLVGWSAAQFSDSLRETVFGFTSLYYALFLLSVLVVVLGRRLPPTDSDFAFTTVATLLYIPTAHGLVEPLLGDYPALFLAGLGLIYLLLGWWVRRWVQEAVLLSGGFITTGIVLLTIAIPVQFKSPVVATMWNLEAMLLVALGIWYTSHLLYGLGVILWVLATMGTLAALMIEPQQRVVLFNERGVALLSWTVGLAVDALVARAHVLRQSQSLLDRLMPRVAVALMAGLGALGGAVWLVTMETYYYFELIGQPESPMAHMLVSLEWTLLGVLLLIGGVVNHSRGIRLLGLATLTFTAFKLFLFDLSFLEMPYRTFTFAGLGLTLLIVSWLYSRYGAADASVDKGYHSSGEGDETDGVGRALG